MDSILTEIKSEREAQDRKWGPCPPRDYPDGTGGAGREAYRDTVQKICDEADAAGQLEWAHILDEEAAEALAETDPSKLRAELLQVAAVCHAWVGAIDARREKTAVTVSEF
jgi:hypothetical protein